MQLLNIGGHGFWDKGGVDTGGCPQKNFPAAFGGRKIFRRRRHRGVKNFFRWGVYLVDRGVILPKNPKKWPHRGVKNFFLRGASHPPLFFSCRVSGNFCSSSMGAPPPPPPCPSMIVNSFLRLIFWILEISSEMTLNLTSFFYSKSRYMRKIGIHGIYVSHNWW